MSSSEYSSWNCAYGLFTECLWFLWPIFAKCSAVVPYSLHVLAAGGAEHPRRRRERDLGDLGKQDDVLSDRLLAVGERRAERARLHLLEAEREHTFGD